MTEAEARIVMRTMIRTMALLNDSILDLQGQMEEADFAAYKAQVAGLMGTVTVDVLADLYARFPHLEPRDTDAWRLAGGLDEAHWLNNHPVTGA